MCIRDRCYSVSLEQEGIFMIKNRGQDFNTDTYLHREIQIKVNILN